MAPAHGSLPAGAAVKLRISRNAPIWAWLLIFMMIASVLGLLNRLTTQVQQADRSRDQLKQVHHILMLYEREHGHFPTLDFFPEEPFRDSESILQVLRPYGLDPAWLISPSAPNVLREHGISFLWNTALNRRSLDSLIEPVWMLVDIQALDDRLPGPHFRSYHILYTDGRVVRSPSPPHTLPVHFDSP